ncbi:metal transporter [Salinirarus marinus]|uniref:metal transporter n=1 Tax=Salinirarus marinus TaxID=3068310 RepID=UPI003C6C1445
MRWQRRSLAGLLGLVLLAPVCAWAAAQTGYAEPMDNAAELAGVASEAVPTGLSLFSGYALPGLGPRVGTLGGALFGTALTLVLALAVGRLLASGAAVR